MTDSLLPQLSIQRLSGDELFLGAQESQPIQLSDFWAWSSSDLLSNAKRGVLAEFFVASDIGTAGGVRVEWDAYDLTTKGGITVEVKSAAYLQSWYQDKPSDIGFSISKSRAWDPATNRFSEDSKRQANVYVFCLLDHMNKLTVNPMDLNQWKFFVVPTKTLNDVCGSMKRLSLKRLLDLSPLEAKYGAIGDAIEEAVNVS